MTDLSESIENHIQANWPMLCFLKPNAQRIEFWFSQGRALKNSGEGRQFYIQAFDPQEQSQVWFADDFDRLEIDVNQLDSAYSEVNNDHHNFGPSQQYDAARARHEQLVASGIEAIKNGPMTKVVLSRKQEFYADKVDWLKLIGRLTQVDQNAFRYLLLHPELGLWCGATPEVLVSVQDCNFSTMALAGTRWPKGNQFPEWTLKEYQEHDWVVREILKALEPFATMQQSAVYNHQAGQIQHLRTDISGTLKAAGSALEIASNLHPTPAVCGFPKNKAFEFIQLQEGYSRLLYTGYVGLFDAEKNNADFYVNLRCLHYSANQFHLYVGGGITEDSDASMEWQETQRKMTTMKQVIAPFIQQR